jgi:hypothetical protein
MARVRPIAIVAAGAGALWLAIGHGFANYDALYALIWGREIAHGHAPQVDVPLAPTSHPLANLVGAVLSVVPGRTGEDVMVALAFVSLAAVAYVVFQLGRLWFGWAAGIAAAAVLLTREPVLSYGVRAYVDVPYLLLVLGALLVEARRPRAGTPVLVLLALAGLLRPEAWLFSVAYLGLLWLDRRPGPAEIALALAGPVLWLGYDLVASGDALRSLHDTRANTQTLGRVTGLQHVPTTLPRRVGEILREPGLAGAVAGAVLGWIVLRERVRMAGVAIVLAIVAYAVLAAAGLPIITRYAFVIAAIGAVLCGAGAFGWAEVCREPWRRRWALVGAAVLVLFAVFAPSQARRLGRTTDAIAAQQGIRDDLYALLDRSAPPAGPVAVANHRLVPLVALATGRDPGEVVTPPHPAGSFIGPANATVARRFILDPRDPVPRVARAPAGLREVARNASWVLYAR